MLQEKLNKLRRFGKDERSSFPYWFAHWKAFNMVALQLGHWKFKYLFHDIEKPWLMLLWNEMDARHADGQLCFDIWKGVGTVLCEFGLATKDEVEELKKRWFDKYGYKNN